MTCVCRTCRAQFEAKQSSKPRRFCSPECYWESRVKRAEANRSTGMKRCAKCGETKLRTAFYQKQWGNECLDGLNSYCKACRCAQERDRRKIPSRIATLRQQYETDFAYRSRSLLKAISKRCRSSGLEFDLDVEWLAQKLATGRCELTGLPFNLSIAGRRSNPYTPTVDRIRAGGAYTKANCRVVLKAVNIALFDWGLDVLLPIAEALIAAQKKSSAA